MIPNSPYPGSHWRHTVGMGVRYGVMGQSKAEVTAGLELLRAHGLEITVQQEPREMAAGRWLARVTPKTPADGEGLVER